MPYFINQRLQIPNNHPLRNGTYPRLQPERCQSPFHQLSPFGIGKAAPKSGRAASDPIVGRSAKFSIVPKAAMACYRFACLLQHMKFSTEGPLPFVL